MLGSGAPGRDSKAHGVQGAFSFKPLFITQGMEIVQTMNSDPGLAVGETNFRSIKRH